MPHKDPTKRAAYLREYKRTVPAGRYAWRDKCSAAARHSNRRAETYGVRGRLTADDVDAILRDASCRYCGSSAPPIGLDHVIPMAKGGPNEPSNLVPACRPCNARKRRAVDTIAWSSDHERCVDCGRTDSPHDSHGRCERCVSRERSRARPRAHDGGRAS